MNPRYDFTGQVALVTGASSGMGLATAHAFAEAGAAVALVDVNATSVHAAAEELTAAGHQALGLRCDVADEDQVADIVAQTVAAFGRLDMAFNNAGIQIAYVGSADETAEDFDRLNGVNYRGVWASMKYELRQMRAGDKRYSDGEGPQDRLRAGLYRRARSERAAGRAHRARRRYRSHLRRQGPYRDQPGRAGLARSASRRAGPATSSRD
jgi:NAD(P)-dependent dehydrogenase (short-subunit alcohol dehydrogenase family)